MAEITDPVVVREVFDVDFGYPLITLDQQGARATRTLLINRNTDINIIDPANGIPQPGDPHPRAPGMICISVTPQRRAQDKHWTPVRCEYTTVSGAPTDLIVEDGDSFHEIIQNETTVQIVADRFGSPLPTVPGGTSTTSRKAFTLELVVTSIRSNPVARDAWLMNMMGRVNQNSVVIPPMLNKPGTGWIATPGQLLFKAVSIQDITARTGLIRLQYSMDLAVDHKVRFRPVGPDGTVAPGAPVVVEVYDPVAFPAGVFW